MAAEPVVPSKSVKNIKKPGAMNGKDMRLIDADRLPSGSDEGE